MSLSMIMMQKYINNTIEMQIPAHVPEEVAHQAQEYAKKRILC